MTQLIENNTWVSCLIDTPAAGEFAPNCKAVVVSGSSESRRDDLSVRACAASRGFSLQNLYDGGPCFSRDILRSVRAGCDDGRAKEFAARENCGKR